MLWLYYTTRNWPLDSILPTNRTKDVGLSSLRGKCQQTPVTFSYKHFKHTGTHNTRCRGEGHIYSTSDSRHIYSLDSAGLIMPCAESYLLWNRFRSICPAAEKGNPLTPGEILSNPFSCSATLVETFLESYRPIKLMYSTTDTHTGDILSRHKDFVVCHLLCVQFCCSFFLLCVATGTFPIFSAKVVFEWITNCARLRSQKGRLFRVYRRVFCIMGRVWPVV
jgi:hypothetical protein